MSSQSIPERNRCFSEQDQSRRFPAFRRSLRRHHNRSRCLRHAYLRISSRISPRRQQLSILPGLSQMATSQYGETSSQLQRSHSFPSSHPNSSFFFSNHLRSTSNSVFSPPGLSSLYPITMTFLLCGARTSFPTEKNPSQISIAVSFLSLFFLLSPHIAAGYEVLATESSSSQGLRQIQTHDSGLSFCLTLDLYGKPES